MCLNFNVDDEIALGSTVTRVALLANTKIDAIIYTFWYVNHLLGLRGLESLTATSYTWAPDHLSLPIAGATHLLNHKGSLSNCLEALTTTTATCRGRGAWLTFSALASGTCISSVE